MKTTLEILENTLNAIAAQSQSFGRDFYKILFDKHPQMQKIFVETDLKQQEKKIISILALIVESMRHKNSAKYRFKKSANKYITYKLVSEYYEDFGEVLFKTLELYLQSKWTPVVALAWNTAYKQFISLIFKGSKERFLCFANSQTTNQSIKAKISKLRSQAIFKKTLYSEMERSSDVHKNKVFVKREKTITKSETSSVTSNILETVKSQPINNVIDLNPSLKSTSYQLKLIPLNLRKQKELLQGFPSEIQNSQLIFEVIATKKEQNQQHYLGFIYLNGEKTWKHLENFSESFISPMRAAKNLLQRLLGAQAEDPADRFDRQLTAISI